MKQIIYAYELCSHCDLLTEIPNIEDGHRALCPRCNNVLTKKTQYMKRKARFYATSALITLFFSMSVNFIGMRLVGSDNTIGLLDIPKILYDDSYWYLALIFLLFVFLLPCLNLIIILLLFSKKLIPKYIKRDLLVVYGKLKPWSMPEIFFIGIIISFVKLVHYGDIWVNQGFFGFFCFIFFYFKAVKHFSTTQMWNEFGSNNYAQANLFVGKTGISQYLKLCKTCKAFMPEHYKHCPRCKQSGKIRDRLKIQSIIALLTTSLLIYIPANLFGMMITVSFDDLSSSTIIDGAIDMWQSGDIPVALIIIIASIMIPILKILALTLLCYFALSTKRQNKYNCRKMNLLYNIIELIGKWSMIDVFVVITLSSLVKNQNVAAVYPDIGIAFFTAVVITTIIAAQRFDPRLIWDRQLMVKRSK